jgi:hypothetical protein
MSPVQNMSTAFSNENRPVCMSNSRAAIAGSSSLSPMPSHSAVHAPSGSVSTDGPAGSAMPAWEAKNPGTQSTRCRTTSRATQPSHGAGLSHAPSGTCATRAVNADDTFR